MIGVDLGGTKIFAGVFNPALECVATTKVSTKAQRGPDAVIVRRRGILRRRMTVALGAALASELAERVLVYVRGAILAGRRARPVSALLAECPA